jgi:predicted ATPase/DNA-binding winged helix-turn-helix (wHTH) protein/Flp pilus assembly protein TadD
LDTAVEFRFGRVVATPNLRRLTIDGEAAKVGARAFGVLMTLIENRGRIVSKAELLDRVWAGVIVEEGNLQVQINSLRRLLGADAIVTVPGRGYQFAARIEGDEAPPRRPEAAPPAFGNLPPAAPKLYGRDADIAAVCALVASHRLVSVVGAGGIGKTRLAQAVAHAWRGATRDGELVIELAGVGEPGRLVSTIARALGLALGPKDQSVASLADAMRGQETLLVLDNCEHLIADVAALAVAIHAAAPKARLLVTSQEPLRLSEERVYRLGPLATPESAELLTAAGYGAVELFVARAISADARFTLNEANVGAVVEICKSLDGLALAIEMAAARAPLLGVEGVRRRLGERFRLLAGGERNALPRHRTMRAALEWSYSLLTDAERTVLDALGVFVGGFSLEAAQKLVADERIDEWTALDHLSALVDKSLVMVGGGEPPRYRLLETTRAFALERLALSGALGAARRRHALALVESFKSADKLESASARLVRTAPDIDNLRAAVAWAMGPDGDRGIAIALFGEADNLWFDVGAGEEGEALFRWVAPFVDATIPAPTAARFWLSRASLLLMKSLREGAAAGLRAAELYREIGDREGRFRALIGAASQFGMAGEFDSALGAVDEAKALIDPGWPAWTGARVEHALGFAHLWNGRPEEARDHFRSALDLYRRDDGDEFYAMQAWMNVVRCEYDVGDYDALERGCRAFLAQAESPARRKHAVATFTVHVSYYLGVALLRLGDVAGAEATLRVAAPRLRRVWGIASWTFGPVALLLACQGRHEDAARLLGWLDSARTPGMVVSSRGHQRAYEDARAIVAPALGEEAFGRLKAEGAFLNEDAALNLAFPACNARSEA